MCAHEKHRRARVQRKSLDITDAEPRARGERGAWRGYTVENGNRSCETLFLREISVSRRERIRIAKFNSPTMFAHRYPAVGCQHPWEETKLSAKNARKLLIFSLCRFSFTSFWKKQNSLNLCRCFRKCPSFLSNGFTRGTCERSVKFLSMFEKFQSLADWIVLDASCPRS